MTSLVMFLKAFPPGPAPEGMKYVALDPPAQLMCGGSDPRCSTAYSNYYSYLKGADGRVLPALLKKYGPADKIAFVGFSAAHGFLNPLLNSDADRAAISAVVLADATFGGGKTGYVKAAKDAAAGKLLLVTTTSDKGTTDILSNGDYAWREFVLKPADLLSMPPAQPVPPMPAPSEGVFQQGNLWYYRYSDAQLHHWDMGKILAPVMQAHILPNLSGAGTAPVARVPSSSVSGGLVVAALIALGLGVWAWSRGGS